MEGQVEWVTAAVGHMQRNDAVAMEPTSEAVDAWVQHAGEILEGTVLANAPSANSWFMGAKIPGKPRGILTYFGGAGAYSTDSTAKLKRNFRVSPSPSRLRPLGRLCPSTAEVARYTSRASIALGAGSRWSSR